MRKLTILAALLTFGLVGAYAQSSSVTLQNQEAATFYYVLDPQDLQGLSAGSPLLATKVAAFFANAQGDPSFSSVGPGSAGRLDNVPDGAHLLVGVFAQDGETDLPVRVLSIDANSKAGDRVYALFATPAQLTVTRGVGRLAWMAPASAATQVVSAQTAASAAPAPAASAPGTAPPDSQTATPTTTTTTTNTTTTTTTSTASSAPSSSTASATTAAAASVPAPAATTAAASPASSPASTASAVIVTPPKLGQIASFASYDPIIFTKEAQGDFSVLPIAQSRGWQLTGTRISGLSGVIDTAGLHLALTVPGGVSESVSYFFYVFATRAAGQTNALTLELEPRAEGSHGACLLWQKGSTEPRLIGSLQSTPTRIELDVSSDDLDAAFGNVPSDTLSADVTSGWYDRALGTWEEFYYTTILAGQIPVTH
jgi:hypothetical protein